jgi:cell division cycle 14
MLTPEHYIPYFKKKNVTLVVRLNDKQYDEKKFLNAGIDHLDLIYPDGTNAPMPILMKFLEACEKTPGAVAVHCKAGLGRTGTCIGSYMMKHEFFTAHELIGWLRLCRPGSVIGPQQQFMESIEQKMWSLNKHAKAFTEASKQSTSGNITTYGQDRNGVMIQQAPRATLFGIQTKLGSNERTQGDKLNDQKFARCSSKPKTTTLTTASIFW